MGVAWETWVKQYDVAGLCTVQSMGCCTLEESFYSCGKKFTSSHHGHACHSNVGLRLTSLSVFFFFLQKNDSTTCIFNRKKNPQESGTQVLFYCIVGFLTSTQGENDFSFFFIIIYFFHSVKNIHTPTLITNSVLLNVPKCVFKKMKM